MILFHGLMNKNMQSPARKIAYLQKKLDHLDNDVFKEIVYDLQKYNNYTNENIAEMRKRVRNNLSGLRQEYKDHIHILRVSQKKQSKQIDLEDSIREIQQTPIPEECFCGCKDLNNEQEHTKERLACNI